MGLFDGENIEADLLIRYIVAGCSRPKPRWLVSLINVAVNVQLPIPYANPMPSTAQILVAVVVSRTRPCD